MKTNYFQQLCVFAVYVSLSSELDQYKLPLNADTGIIDMRKMLGNDKRGLLWFIDTQTDGDRLQGILESVAAKLAEEDATAHVVDCSKEGKKVCEDLRMKPEPYIIRHFHNGRLSSPYQGKGAEDSILRFFRDPEAELPWEDIPSRVIHLQEEDFEEFLRQKRHALVMFYAPWCVHCRNAKPHFMAAADEMVDAKIAFAAVDCTKVKPICDDAGISGYPTINYYNYFNMFSEEYTGENKKADFLNYLEKMVERFKSTRKEKTEL